MEKSDKNASALPTNSSEYLLISLRLPVLFLILLVGIVFIHTVWGVPTFRYAWSTRTYTGEITESRCVTITGEIRRYPYGTPWVFFIEAAPGTTLPEYVITKAREYWQSFTDYVEDCW